MSVVELLSVISTEIKETRSFELNLDNLKGKKRTMNDSVIDVDSKQGQMLNF